MADVTQSTQHWAKAGEHSFIFGMRVLYAVHHLLGRRVFRALAFPWVLGHWLLRPQLRATSTQYLQRLQKSTGALRRPVRWYDSLRHTALFADTMLDKLLAAAGQYPRALIRFTAIGQELQHAAASGQGGLIVTAHMGCVELCRGLPDVHRKMRLNVLVHTRHAQHFNDLLQRLNPSNPVRLIEVNEIGPHTAMILNERIAAGEFVAIAADRIPVQGSKTVQVHFLGEDAPFPVGPWVLASLLKCPVWFLACVHEGVGYHVHVEKISEQIVLPRATRQLALHEQASRYAKWLEHLLIQSPYDWFNFFPFWEQPRQ